MGLESQTIKEAVDRLMPERNMADVALWAMYDSRQ